jgi:hypothetical protein
LEEQRERKCRRRTVWEAKAEDISGERWQRHRRERTGPLCEELKSFGRKRIDIDILVFILQKCINSGSSSKPMLISDSICEPLLTGGHVIIIFLRVKLHAILSNLIDQITVHQLATIDLTPDVSDSSSS